jgi:hypothetical protein
MPIFDEKLAFFSKTNFMIKTSSRLSEKTPIFAKFFGKNIFKIITSVPEHCALCQSADNQESIDKRLVSYPSCPKNVCMAGLPDATYILRPNF